MGILSKFTDKNKGRTTRGFYFGSTEAEAENKKGQDLLTYFDDYLKILPLLDEGRFIFLGRKGSGKSAIAKFIKDSADKEDNSYATLVRMQDFELEKLIQGEGFKSFENREAVIFEWLILVQIIQLIIKNESSRWINEYSKLKNFIERNSGMVQIDKYQIDEIVKNNDYEVSFAPLRHVFGGVFKQSFGTKTTKAPFYKLIPPLREIVKTIVQYDVNKDQEFWLLFDDLDITFQAGNHQQNMITELLRLAKHYNNEIFKGTCSNILVFLRDDIKKKIEANYPDTAKLFSSYEIKLDWYDHQTFKVDENATNLKSFINRRIELNFQKNDISYDKTNPWSTLIPNDIDEYQNKSSFKYLIDFTFYRPRDLILFFSIVGHKDYQYPLHPKIVKALLKKYIYSNIVEIKNELSLNFSPNEIQTLFYDVFPYIIQNNRLTKSKLIEKLKDYEFDMDNNKVFELIEDYNLIAFKSPQGNLYFGHREDKLNEDERESYFLILPKCIFHHYTEIN